MGQNWPALGEIGLITRSHLHRSSCPVVFCKNGVLINFAKFTGKHLCQRLCFNKVAGQVCNFIKKQSVAQVFSCEFCEIYKNTFFYLRWLLLLVVSLLCLFINDQQWLLLKQFNHMMYQGLTSKLTWIQSPSKISCFHQWGCFWARYCTLVHTIH